MNERFGKMPASPEGQAYRNELPDGAATVTAIEKQQKRYFSQDEIDQMTIDYTENRLTVYQLADKYGRNRNTVSSVLKRNGVVVTRERMDESAIRQAKQLFADGLSLKQVGQQLGICESTIRKTLMRSGVPMRLPRRYTSEMRARDA
jgi:DNA-binding CsgD family transcriptional regulator